MDFTYSDFHGRLVLNPQDFILRFEHSQNGRIFEQTFFERDFLTYGPFGGLEFIGRLFHLATKGQSSDVKIMNFLPTPTKLSFEVQFMNAALLQPLQIAFTIPAVRKQSGGADMDSVARKVKDLSEVVGPLEEKVKMLEERCSGCIFLSGCMLPISDSAQSVTLVKGNSQLPTGQAFMFLFPKCSVSCGNATLPYTSPMSVLQSYTPAYDPNVYVYDSLKSIKQLAFLKNCTTLTLSGCNEITDFSPIGEMSKLTHLTIVSSRQWNGSTMAHRDGNPQVKDLSWIRKLKNLRVVSFLGCNQLVDITPLRDLPVLAELDIRETGVRNTECLSVTNPQLKITR